MQDKGLDSDEQRDFRRRMVGGTLFIAAVWAMLLVKPFGHGAIIAIDDIAGALGPLYGFFLCFNPGARDASGSRRQRWAALFLGLGCLSYALGQALWTYDEIVLRHIPTFSWANLAYLAAYPVLLVGILLLPIRPLEASTRARIALDGALILAAIVTFSWYFVLGPTILHGTGPISVRLSGAAAPCGDLVLFLCVLILWFRAGDRGVQADIALLSLGLGLIAVADSVFAYQKLHGAYVTGGLIDPLWPLGYMAIGWGAWAARRRSSRTRHTPSAQRELVGSRWHILLPYVPYTCVPAVGLLTLSVWQSHGDGMAKPGVYIGSVAVVALVFVRQIAAIRALQTMSASNSALSDANTQLEVMATTDALTSLPNRTLFHRRVRQALDATQRNSSPLAVLLMDLDRFKEVNDTFGHHYGDLLLQRVSDRLHRVQRATGLVARLGGDEFAVLLPRCGDAGAIDAARALLHSLEEPIVVEGQSLDVGASIGIALCPDHGKDLETLLRQADVAMYAAKRAHLGYAIYDPTQDEHSPHRLSLMGELRQALIEQRLTLHYQPLIDVRDARLKAVEALLRWPRADGGFIPPDQFIPLAEHIGLIEPLTQWVLNEALRQCKVWQAAGLTLGVQVNLSARTVQNRELPAQISAALAQHAVAPKLLTLEITESALMVDPMRALEVLTQVSRLGVRVAIDDFGTGYSSLAYLKRLPVDEVKIDKTFVLGMGSGRYTGEMKDKAIVHSVVSLAHALGLDVVAEGVETTEAWDMLQALKCDTAQGYYMSRPLPPNELERWIEETQTDEGRASA